MSSKQTQLCVVLLCMGLSLLGAACSSSRSPTKAPSGAELAKKYDRQLIKLMETSTGTDIERAKIYIVQDDKKQWVTSEAWIKNHGFAWPAALGNGQVKRLSREELDAIPEGPTINTER